MVVKGTILPPYRSGFGPPALCYCTPLLGVLNVGLATLKCYFHLLIGNFWGVLISDFYWFGFLLGLARCLGSWDVYFLLQCLLNGGNLGFFWLNYSTNKPIRPNYTNFFGKFSV